MAFDERRPFTPETLAERWECSAATVRGMAKTGELRSFKVGSMYRIPHIAVEEYEATPAVVKMPSPVRQMQKTDPEIAVRLSKALTKHPPK